MDLGHGCLPVLSLGFALSLKITGQDQGALRAFDFALGTVRQF